MSLVVIKPYFVSRLEGLGYREHDEPTFSDIQENKLNKSFHVELGDIASRKNDQQSLEISCPVTVRAFYKNSNRESARDKAIEGMHNIITDVLASTNRLNVSGLKNVTFQGAKREPYSDSNVDDQVAVLSFTAFVIYGT